MWSKVIKWMWRGSCETTCVCVRQSIYILLVSSLSEMGSS